MILSQVYKQWVPLLLRVSYPSPPIHFTLHHSTSRRIKKQDRLASSRMMVERQSTPTCHFLIQGNRHILASSGTQTVYILSWQYTTFARDSAGRTWLRTSNGVTTKGCKDNFLKYESIHCDYTALNTKFQPLGKAYCCGWSLGSSPPPPPLERVIQRHRQTDRQTDRQTVLCRASKGLAA